LDTILASSIAPRCRPTEKRLVEGCPFHRAPGLGQHGGGPRQDLAQSQGNSYLRAQFPRLDFIKRATTIRFTWNHSRSHGSSYERHTLVFNQVFSDDVHCELFNKLVRCPLPQPNTDSPSRRSSSSPRQAWSMNVFRSPGLRCKAA